MVREGGPPTASLDSASSKSWMGRPFRPRHRGGGASVATPPQPGDELIFVPLGGAGEIGMNLNLYGYGPEAKRQWIMIDLGVMFGGDDTPGVDVIMPDPGFIEEHRRNLLGIVLTHAHEDHIGAVGHLWSRL